MNNSITYLETYVLQQDMRIRLPKSILTNLGVEKGITMFDIYLDHASNEVILKIHKNEEEKK